MDNRYTLKTYVPVLLLMWLAGWGGLVYLVTQTQPFVWARWFFFASLFIAATASAFPFIYFWHRWRCESPDLKLVMRQSFWVGFYAGLYAWLEMMFSVSFGLAAGLAVGLFALESAIRVMEQARLAAEAEEDADD